MAEKMTAMQIAALAAVLHELRPDWVTAPTAAALRNRNDGTRPYPAIALAAVNAAVGGLVTTPGGIFEDGPHWHTQGTAPAPAGERPPQRCPDHGTYRTPVCTPCRSEWLAPDDDGNIRPQALIGRHWDREAVA